MQTLGADRTYHWSNGLMIDTECQECLAAKSATLTLNETLQLTIAALVRIEGERDRAVAAMTSVADCAVRVAPPEVAPQIVDELRRALEELSNGK